MTDERPSRRPEPGSTEPVRPAATEVRPRRMTVSDQREAAPVRRRPDEEQLRRARGARQILSGAEIERPTRLSSSWAAPSSPISESQRTYLVSLLVLLAIGLILAFTVGFGIASIFFFLLALGLIGGWLAF